VIIEKILEPVGARHEGEMTSMTFSVRLLHAPSRMQLSEWSGTPKNEMHKKF